MPLHYLYRTTHVPTGRFYIGVRTSQCAPETDRYLGSGVRLLRCVGKYPRSEFSKEILFVFGTKAEALRAERDMVSAQFLADPRCLNLVTGGQAGGRVGPCPRKFREQTRARVLRLWADPVWKARMLESHRNRPKPTEETCRKISQATMGRSCSNRMRKAVATANRLRRGHWKPPPVSAETRLRMSISAKRRCGVV